MSTAIKLGDIFSAKVGSATRKFRVFIKNIDVTTSNGVATVSIGSIGLRKTEGGDVTIPVTGSPKVRANITGAVYKERSLISPLSMDGTAPVDKTFDTNWHWSFNQTDTAQTKTLTFWYSKDTDTNWGGNSSGSMAITIPAFNPDENDVSLTELMATRGNNNIVTTFKITGRYTVNSVSVSINGTVYTPTQSGNTFTATANIQPATATVIVNANVTPTGKSAIPLSDQTFISGSNVAIDFFSPSENNYNIGIGTEAWSTQWSNNGRVDINGDLFINGTAYEPASSTGLTTTTVSWTFSSSHAEGEEIVFPTRTSTLSGYRPLGIVGVQSNSFRLVINPYLSAYDVSTSTATISATGTAAGGSIASGRTTTVTILWVQN